jgi:hypothetical protein
MAVNPAFLVTAPTPLNPLQRAAPKVAKAIDPNSGARKLCCVLDGVLAQARPGRDVGAPLPGAMQFLVDAKAAGYNLYILNDRPATVVCEWLRRNSPPDSALEQCVQICSKRPQNVDIVLDACAIRFDGNHFPQIAELEIKPWWDAPAI